MAGTSSVSLLDPGIARRRAMVPRSFVAWACSILSSSFTGLKSISDSSEATSSGLPEGPSPSGAGAGGRAFGTTMSAQASARFLPTFTRLSVFGWTSAFLAASMPDDPVLARRRFSSLETILSSSQQELLLGPQGDSRLTPVLLRAALNFPNGLSDQEVSVQGLAEVLSALLHLLVRVAVHAGHSG
eukprot:CAMPEP_0175259606 /NCGR_PEP_ID=MMETSP0093-20121207/39823_1 /TAXON_ID=311494 /ORGANISM="Alexandrium monilatum, Strain CCMP3105" /LENGTH=185 /DNA_ID=CAMNT_0016554023 /DNA_START=101 /DNA_END=654 /DNA_ORIENTATION=-